MIICYGVWVFTLNMGGSQVLILKKIIIFLFLKIEFVLVNSAEPDEMLHYAAFHLGLHSLPKYLSTSTQNKRVKPFHTQTNGIFHNIVNIKLQ